LGAENALADLEAAEEALRRDALGLQPEQLKAFYDRSQAAFKDPDVYTTLAWLFVAGLHHFYLKRWRRGLIDLGINGVGLILVVLGVLLSNWWIGAAGVVLWLGVSATELMHMLRGQRTVREYNLREQRQILDELKG